jgi:hypothetical protein
MKKCEIQKRDPIPMNKSFLKIKLEEKKMIDNHQIKVLYEQAEFPPLLLKTPEGIRVVSSSSDADFQILGVAEQWICKINH